MADILGARSLFVFGAGGLGTAVAYTLYHQSGKDIAGFLDSNLEKCGRFAHGYKVYHPDDPSVAGRNPLVVLAALSSENIQAMRDVCRRLGYETLTFAELPVSFRDILRHLPPEPARMEILGDIGIPDAVPVLAWSGVANFGDMLSKPIIERLFGKPTTVADFNSCRFGAIGSYLDKFLCKDAVPPGSCETVHVWGGGFRHEPEARARFFRPMRFHALRGELSKRSCEKILQTDLEHVLLGDPGLLARLLINDRHAIPVIYDVGIVPHYLDRGHPLFSRIRFEHHSSVVLDVRQEPDVFLRQLLSCRVILSSALHPLIAADSFGIPNKWISCGWYDRLYGYFKYDDYYSIYGLRDCRPWLLAESDIGDGTVERIAGEYAVSQDIVEKAIENLSACFPRDELKEAR